MPLLPPVEQTFTVDAADFMAGINEMLATTDQLAKSIDLVIASAGKLSGAVDDAAASAKELSVEERLASDAAKAEADAFDALVASTRATTAAVNEASAAIDKEIAALDGATASAGKTDESTAAVGAHGKVAFLALAAAVGYSVVKGAEFQEQMTRLQTAAGLTGANMGQLGKTVLQLGDRTGYTGTEIATALYHPISAGLSLNTALKLVANSAKLAQIHGADLEDTTYALSSVMKSYNQSAGDAGKTSALLNSIVGQGDMRFQDFVQSVNSWAPTGAAMGISIRSMGSALAYLTDRGNSAETAATRLTMGLSMVTSPSKEASTFLGALGLEAGSVALKGKSLADVMNHYGVTTSRVAADLRKPDGIYVALSDIKGAFTKAGLSADQADAVMSKIFGGGRSDKAILSLMQNLGGLQTKYKDVGKGASDYGQSWAKTQQTVAFEFHKTVSSVENLATSFGVILLPAVNKVLGGLDKVFEVLQKNPALAAFAGGLITIAVAMKAMAGIEAVLGGVSAGIETMAAAADSAVPEVTALDAALDANVIAIVAVAVLALAAGLYELYKHCKLVREIVADVGHFFQAVWKTAMAGAGAVIQWFVSGPLVFIKQEIAVFSAWWKQNGAEIEKITKAVWSVISVLIKLYIDLIKADITAGLDVIKTVWNVAWALISNYVKMVWDVMATMIRAEIRIVLDIISVVLDLIQGKWGAAWDSLKDIVSTAFNAVITIIKDITSGFDDMLFDAGKALIQGLINGIKDMFGAAVGAIKDLANGVVGAAKSVLGIFSPSKVMHEIGLEIGRGLVKGLEGSASSVKEATDKLASIVKRAFEDKLISDKTATSLTDFIERDNTRLQNLANKRAAILKTIAAAKQYAIQTTQNVESFAGLSNIISAMPAGSAITSAGLEAGLRTDLATIKKFNDAIRKLSKLGLNKNILNQIVQAGPADGLQIAEALLNGPVSEIRAMNATERQITSQATAIGKESADAMYDAGKDAGKGFLSGLEHQQKQIEKLMEKDRQGDDLEDQEGTRDQFTVDGHAPARTDGRAGFCERHGRWPAARRGRGEAPVGCGRVRPGRRGPRWWRGCAQHLPGHRSCDSTQRVHRVGPAVRCGAGPADPAGDAADAGPQPDRSVRCRPPLTAEEMRDGWHRCGAWPGPRVRRRAMGVHRRRPGWPGPPWAADVRDRGLSRGDVLGADLPGAGAHQRRRPRRSRGIRRRARRHPACAVWLPRRRR